MRMQRQRVLKRDNIFGCPKSSAHAGGFITGRRKASCWGWCTHPYAGQPKKMLRSLSAVRIQDADSRSRMQEGPSQTASEVVQEALDDET